MNHPLLNRSVFYVSRMISSQKERDFEGMNYQDIKQVFSIWLCMNMKTSILDFIHLTKESVLESYPWKGRLDLLNIVLIGISNDLPEPDESREPHYLLSALFSNRLTETEKIEIIEKEYHINIDRKMRKDVDSMCNLGQGILELGISQGISQGMLLGEAKGKAEGRAQMLIMLSREDGMDDATILKRLQEKVNLTLEQATAYLQQYGK